MNIKVLLIAPYPIMPPDTGAKIRVFELAHSLSQQDMQVTVLMPMSPILTRRKQINPRLTLEVAPYPFLAAFLLTNKPFPYMFLISFHSGFRFLVQRYLNEFDIIQFEQASFGNLLKAVPPHKVVIFDAHNVESDYVKSECQSKWTSEISANRISKLEKRLVRRADRILACSNEDVEKMAKLYQSKETKFVVVPNGIHLRKEESSLSIEETKVRFPTIMNYAQRGIFSGSDVAHNRKTVRFLTESLAPQMRHRCAFIIQGQCGRQFQNHNSENVFLDPRPGNVGLYANVCTVALNPVMQGSGTSLKVLDYLKHGLPVLSTKFGARGYEDLVKYITITEPENFVEALSQRLPILSDPKDALKKYSWQSIGENLGKILLHSKMMKNGSDEII